MLCLMCVCVLTGLRDGKYDLIMRMWGSKPQSVIATYLYSVAYCCVLLPCPLCYSIPQRIYHTMSLSHFGVARIRPRIPTYNTRSSAQPGISCLYPSIQNSLSASPNSPVSYCMALFPCRLLLFASGDISSKFDLSCFSAFSWLHHSSLLRPSLP